jgi:GNAT superfamily N-acetyltransferase
MEIPMNSAATFTIHRAGTEQVDEVLRLRTHAEHWLANAGIEQWTASAVGEKSIRAHIERGSTYIVRDEDQIVCATFTLDGGDRDFWTEEELAEPAVYLYKFIVHSAYRGTGLGEALMNWICRRADAAGARLLRLDCWRTNEGLHAYYLNRGFRQVDVRSAYGRKSGALFERDTTIQTPTSPGTQLIDLTDESTPEGTTGMEAKPRINNYDPTGEAAVWQAASRHVMGMQGEKIPGDTHDHWNAALVQAARALDVRAREIRQAGGMYYRVMNGVPSED